MSKNTRITMNNVRLKNAITNASLILGVFGLYLFYVRGFLFGQNLFLTHDNVRYHYPFFMYVSDSFRFGFGMPHWYPSNGGTPMGILSASLFPYLPHRIIGYIFHLALDGLSAYRATLMSGMFMVTSGLWFLIRRLTGNRLAATLSATLFLFGGCGITIFHQEQIIVSMSVLPWMALLLLKIKDDTRFLALLAVLFGVSTSIHYPQIQTISSAIIVSVMVVFGSACKNIFLKIIKDKKTLIVSISLLAASILPSLYIGLNIRDFSSPLRQSSTTGASDYSEYIKLNNQQFSSATIDYFKNYINPSYHENDDGFLFFATYPALLLALSAFILNFRRSAPVIVLLIFFIWASLGIHGGLPQLLYISRFPFIGQFRQWLHFVPLANMSLIVLSAIGFDELTKKLQAAPKHAKTMIAALAVLTLLFAFAEGSRYLRMYEQYMVPSITPHSEPDKETYLSLLKENSFSSSFLSKYHTYYSVVSPIVMFKGYMLLQSKCPQSIVQTPFSAGQTFDVSSFRPSSRLALIDLLCMKNLMGHIVPVTGSGIEGLSAANLQAIQSDSIAPALRRNDSSVFSSYIVTPNGVTAKGAVTAPSLLVFPFAHKNDFDAAFNGDKIKTHPAFEGAMTAISVPAGEFSVSLSQRISMYEIGVILQYASLAFSAIYVFGSNSGNQQRGKTP